MIPKTDGIWPRLIHIQSCLGKVVEKIIFDRILNQLPKDYFDKQYAYLPNTEICHSLLNLFQQLVSKNTKTKSWYRVIISLLDLICAFDEISRTLILDIFNVYLDRGLHQLIKSYLSYHIFVLWRLVIGSVLGPLLFIIGLQKIISKFNKVQVKITSYADDIILTLPTTKHKYKKWCSKKRRANSIHQGWIRNTWSAVEHQQDQNNINTTEWKQNWIFKQLFNTGSTCTI